MTRDCLPLFSSQIRTGNRFMAMLLFHHFLNHDDLIWLITFELHNLVGDEMNAMISAREVGAINNTTFRSLNRECDTLSASKYLRRLVDFWLLDKKGRGSRTYYVPSAKALENWPASVQASGKSTELESKSTELSTELQQRVQGAGRKSDKSSLLQLVVDILKERPLSAAELASILGRTQKHIRMEYLQPVLDQGRITRSNPEKPTDPNQVYSADPTASGMS